MCEKNADKDASPTRAMSNTNTSSNTNQNRAGAGGGSTTRTFLFTCIMGMSITTIFSTLLQLEKVYFYEESKKPLAKMIPIPILSTLAFQESMVLCAISTLLLAMYIHHQLKTLKLLNLNMPHVTTKTQLPFLGTALEFLSNTPWDLMESWHRTYGSIYTFKLLGRTMVSIEDPMYLKEVLQSKIQNVKKDVDFAYKPFLPILGKGIVTSEGKSWMKQRRKISTALKIEILEDIPRATLNATQRLMAKLENCCIDQQQQQQQQQQKQQQQDQDIKTIDIAEELRHLTLQVISETFMSLEAEESDNTFATMYLPIVEEGNKRVWRPERSFLFFTPSFWKHIFHVLKLNRYVSTLILKRWELRTMEQKQKQKQGKNESFRRRDILDKVLDHFEKDFPGRNLSSSDVRQLRDEFKTFIMAGHETSAAMMAWTFYELMRDDDLTAKV